MKFILLVVLATIISYFVWNMLRRIFGNRTYGHQRTTQQQNTTFRNDKIDRKVNWDAETVDYDEVKEEKKDQL